MLQYDIVVIGGGPAGLAAAIEARKNGVKKILIIERDRELGGILQQCIHNGFGLHIFKEELTGPEYAERFIKELITMDIEYKLDTMVLEVSDSKVITAMNATDGILHIQAKAIILAMGCRERTRGAIRIPGTRPAGVMAAGTAQRFVNIEGDMIGKRIVILGSGDIGLIMARRLTLEGADVLAVAELMSYSGGLTRNIVQCLEDFNIPLYLNHTVVNIEGHDRVEAVTIAQVDEKYKPIKGTEKRFECDTLLLSVGLIPENELSKSAGIALDNVTGGPIVNESMETSVEGIFACGNVVHVHDLVDWVTEESRRAGSSAAKYIKGQIQSNCKTIKLKGINGVRYVVPHQIRLDNIEQTVELMMRVDNIYKDIKFVIKSNGEVIKEVKRKHVAPGEMETIKLDLSKFTPGDCDEMYIEIVEKEA
ncbi:FAD-dependent pyridine nucleotide-disulphide oxidoreductase [Alkaliphilus metalliredigens QYMF]|uniref:FAD-dependent pyridine nucleotide-disulphide oxidoreductase n=1 Tax=Alkaliphilus metalliredigens (strain QYMF) TaxID=293826 RepID=A6TLX3_ALKMQ|nr:NAD(P)/FAD-dependent oxidoreductase [Alkaliphilus metalliredigens]ABR47191.1 FAD-dependent pyridine nucleotide-disulphide oxidoreductase [Alkaliphilus metalliredigens QYMF]